MIPQAPRKTLADYMVAAISPVLIMLLVGSLSFFLIKVFYRGELAGNVRWVVFWFVIAVVLVARIGIEQGSGYAAVYGLALAAATWLYLVWLHPAYVLGIILLGMIWWCANKLTRDCTLIDEDDDASGRGLLQVGRAKKNAEEKKAAETEGKKPGAKPGLPRKSERRASRARPPGLWVVYFSLAALPLFGIGQMLLRGGDTASRRAGLALLFIYLMAALGLLLTTSFLGLRRYLRQRFVAMPGTIAFGWIRFGAGVALAVLIAALLVPRPGVNEAWSTLRYQVDYQLRRASEYAARMGGHGKGEGRPGSETGEATTDRGAGAMGRPGENQGRVSSTRRTPRTTPDETARTAGRSRNQPTPLANHAAGRWYVLFRDLFFVAVAIVILSWLVRRRHLIVQIIQSLIAALIHFFRNLFAFPTKLRERKGGRSLAGVKCPAFARYENPFVTGRDRSWTPEELILYSYEALRAWAEEQGVKPRPQQTAREFCFELGGKFPEVNSELARLAYLHGHAAYGVGLPPGSDLALIGQLWRYLTATVATRTA